MSMENQHMEFTDDEVGDQAKGNAVATMLALFLYAREHGETPETAARWVGKLFALGWTDVQNQAAHHAARLAALNCVSLGATLQSLSGDERRAEVIVAGVPDRETADVFGLNVDEADAIFTIFEPIAYYLGMQYRWQREGDTVTMVFEQGTA